MADDNDVEQPLLPSLGEARRSASRQLFLRVPLGRCFDKIVVFFSRGSERTGRVKDAIVKADATGRDSLLVDPLVDQLSTLEATHADLHIDRVTLVKEGDGYFMGLFYQFLVIISITTTGGFSADSVDCAVSRRIAIGAASVLVATLLTFTLPAWSRIRGYVIRFELLKEKVQTIERQLSKLKSTCTNRKLTTNDIPTPIVNQANHDPKIPKSPEIPKVVDFRNRLAKLVVLVELDMTDRVFWYRSSMVFLTSIWIAYIVGLPLFLYYRECTG